MEQVAFDSMGVGFPAQTSRQLHRSPTDIPKVPIPAPSSRFTLLKRLLICAVSLTRFCSLSTPATWQLKSLRCPLLPYFPITLTATQDLPPFSVPQPCPLSHLTESWNRVSLHQLCHVLWFRSKSEVPPTFKKKGLYQV